MTEVEMRKTQPCAEPEPKYEPAPAPVFKKEPEITVDDDELELSEDEPKTLLERCWYAVTKAGEAAGFDVPDIKSLEVDNTVVDTVDLPKSWTFNSFIFYQCCFWALAAFFFARNYILCRTSTFISLDSGAGVCKGDNDSDKCCEVPTAITGDFMADAFGRWNTFPNFNYNFNNYQLTMTGVSYTNEEYAKLMSKISKEVKAIGSRGKNRDYSWNMVAWSSFTSIDTSSGFFKFYLSGDVGIIFAKSIIGIGFASNTSACTQPITASINSATREIDVRVNLCSEPPCKANPCPGILSPQAFGYDTESASSGDMEFTVDLAAINTALAVNMGIVPLSNLVSYVADNSRISLLQAMYQAGSIPWSTVQNTTSYYEPLYAPMSPIYCTSYNHVNTTSCYVRIGNSLVYPVINHFGWSETGYDYPTRCIKATASVSGSAAHYYCNKMDLVTGLVYYPLANVNITDLVLKSTWSPTRQPTQNPSPLPGSPTAVPTSARPSASPTTAAPTYIKTKKPTQAPSEFPTSQPSRPTVEPTPSPTIRRTRRPTVGVRRLEEKEIQPEDILIAEAIIEEINMETTNTTVFQPSSVPTVAPSPMVPVEAPTSAPSPMAPVEAPTSSPTVYDIVPYYDDFAYYGSSSSGSTYFGTSFYFSSTPADSTFGTIGTSASAAFYEDLFSSSSDGFVPLVPQIVDNGLIFQLGKLMAEKLAKGLSNDEYMSRISYEAMISTVLGKPNDMKGKKSTWQKDFGKLCNGTVVAAGCAMFAFEVYGGDNRVVNEFLYQPSTTPAFTDTLYSARTMAVIMKRAPTSLIETYYSCVLGIWDSIFQAIGLANSSVQFFITVGFFIYFYLVVTYLNKVQRKEIELLKEKKKRLAREAKMREKQLDRVATVFSVMKTRFDALCDDVKAGDRNFSGFERAVLLTEEEAVAAAAKANQDLGISEIDSAPHGYNHVTSKEDADANV